MSFPVRSRSQRLTFLESWNEGRSRNHRADLEPRFVHWNRTRVLRCLSQILSIRPPLQAEPSRQDGHNCGTMSQASARAQKVMRSDMASPPRTNSRAAFLAVFFTHRSSKKIHVITGGGKVPLRIGCSTQ